MAREYRREELEFGAISVDGRVVLTARIEDFTISISIIANPDSPFKAAVRWSAPGEKHYTALYATADEAVDGSCKMLGKLAAQLAIEKRGTQEFERHLPSLEDELRKLGK